MRNLIFILSFILSLNASLQSQIKIDWKAYYYSPGIYEAANSVELDQFGNVFVAGGIEANSGDYIILKYNSLGVLQWLRTYNGQSNEQDGLTSMTMDQRGNVYVTGYSSGTETSEDYLTIKYNSSGEQLWIARYDSDTTEKSGPTIYSDIAYDIEVDSLENVYVAGSSGTIKYDSAGILQWIVKDNMFISDMFLDKFGNVCITGFMDSTYETSRVCKTVKYNSSGVRQWIAKYDGSVYRGIDQGYAVTSDDSENVYVAGSADESTAGSGYSLYLTIKYNKYGVQQWLVKHGTGTVNVARCIEADDSGNVYVSGLVNAGYPIPVGSYGTIKYNSSGMMQWLRESSGKGAQQLKLNHNNIYITGHDYALKYNTQGDLIWSVRYNGSVNLRGEINAIALDNSDNVYVTGYTSDTTGNLDIATLRFSQILTGNINTSGKVPVFFNLNQNYPNPFNPSTVISYQLPVSNFVNIKVYNSTGNELTTLVNDKQNAGSYFINFDASNFPSGVYYYKLSSGNFTDTKKMILLK